MNKGRCLAPQLEWLRRSVTAASFGKDIHLDSHRIPRKSHPREDRRQPRAFFGKPFASTTFGCFSRGDRTEMGSVNACRPGIGNEEELISLGEEISELLGLSPRHFLPLSSPFRFSRPSYPAVFWDPSKGCSVVEVAPRRNPVTPSPA